MKEKADYEEGWRLSTGELTWLDAPISPEGIVEAKLIGDWESSIYNLELLREANPRLAKIVSDRLLDQARRLNQLRRELGLPKVECHVSNPDAAKQFEELLQEAFPFEFSDQRIKVTFSPWRTQKSK